MAILYLLISVLLIILLTVRFKVHPFVALLLVAMTYGFMAGMPMNQIIESVNVGFGNTLGGIGMIIILGVIIGAFLEKSGGAYALADKVIKVTGPKRVPTAMGIIGWIVSIPVFADSGFILLSPLNKSLSKKAGISLSGSAIALGLGLGAAHTMVPPTPGPIYAANELGADLGLVMLVGIPVSILALIVGLVFAKRYVSRFYIDPNPDITEEEIAEQMKSAPGAMKSSLPIIIPILLIIVKSLLVTYGYSIDSIEYDNYHVGIRSLLFIGEPFVALIIGMFLSFTLPRKLDKEMFSTSGWIGQALVSAAAILLITGAGGIFGQILRDSGIATLLGDILGGVDIGIWLPFLLAASLKTAQGSSTVALTTTAAILAPIMGDLGFDTGLQKAMVVIAIGAGSLVVSHANDSFFWVLTRLSGMNVNQGYRFFSFGTLITGTSAALILFLVYVVLT